MPDAPRVSLAPEGIRPFLKDAIVAGGGVVSDPEQADAIIWADPSDPAGLRRLLDRSPTVRWVQLPWAGVEPYVGVLDHDRIWTAGKGVYAEEVAEHALGLALGAMRNIGAYARSQTWLPPAGVSLHGARVTILGAGGIAESLVRLLSPFDCRVTVVRRRAMTFPGVERTARREELPSILPDTDLVVLALALTPETDHIIDHEMLAMMSSHAWLVNVARGRHVVTADLVAALDAGAIAGAALDVTDPEPLPDGHPLWTNPRCIVTPHVANTPEMAKPVLMRRVSENVRRFAAGEPLLGVVDVDAGY